MHERRIKGKILDEHGEEVKGEERQVTNILTKI